MKKILQQWVPWIVVVLVFYLLFQKIPPSEIFETFSYVRLGPFIFYSLVYFLLMLVFDVVSLEWIFRRFVTHVGFVETLYMRGATYLLMLLNYNLAQGGMALYLRKTHQAPTFQTLGAIFLTGVVDLTLVFSFSFVAIFYGDVVYRGVSLRPFILNFGAVFYALVCMWFLFWFCHNTLFVKKLTRKWGLFQWVLNKKLFIAFREMEVRDLFMVMLLRLPLTLTIMFSVPFILHAFQSSVSFHHIFTYIPVVMFVGTLPITPAGMGTGQALMVDFFKGSLVGPAGLTAEQILFSSSLIWAFVNLVLKSIFGAYCLHKKSRHLFMPN
ncbi:MAG TPA: hypothetical protein DDW49_04495 [Deltaproteobacteria bacterium]|nr:MAG: hypothetical protein A2048_06660 [Deltaproteobacteria bacterium GWA2_45_12]HBF12639.1 hypothetical protein [Deltaproteobacteria bacterium]